MGIATVAHALLAVALLVAALAKTWDAWASISLDRPARSLTVHIAAGFWLLALGNGLSLPFLAEAFDELLTCGASKATFNVAIVLGAGLVLAFFYRASSRRSGARSPAAAVTIALAALTAVAQVTFLVATPKEYRSHNPIDPGGAPSSLLIFYAIGIAWLVWAYARSSVFSLSYTQSSSGLLKMACSSITVGLVIVSTTSALRLAIITVGAQSTSPGVVLKALNTANFAADSAGQTLVAAGMSALGLVRIADARRRWRTRRDLEPLRRILTEAFPEIRLLRSPNGKLNTATVSSYDRCLIEIWDGLIRLSAPLNELVGKRSRSEVLASDLAKTITDATDGRPYSGLDKPVIPSPHLLAVLGNGENKPNLEAGSDLLVAIAKEIRNGRVASSKRCIKTTNEPLSSSVDPAPRVTIETTSHLHPRYKPRTFKKKGLPPISPRQRERK